MSKAFEDWWTNGEVRYFEQDNHVALKDAFEAGRAIGRKETSTPPAYAQGQEEMRERAAKEIIRLATWDRETYQPISINDYRTWAIERLRALPIKEGGE